jgi:hypothetical protein
VILKAAAGLVVKAKMFCSKEFHCFVVQKTSRGRPVRSRINVAALKSKKQAFYQGPKRLIHTFKRGF